MSRPIRIEAASGHHAGAIARIYGHFVGETAVSFELEAPGAEEMARRIDETWRWTPWLVLLAGEEVAGYAYACRHRTRPAYQWSVEVSVYVDPRHQRLGFGRRLYEVLFGLLRQQGFVVAHAGITLPNPASVGLHESLGFRPIGVYPAVGFKMGRWHDVGWWRLELQPPPLSPPAPQPPAALKESQSWPLALDIARS